VDAERQMPQAVPWLVTVIKIRFPYVIRHSCYFCEHIPASRACKQFMTLHYAFMLPRFSYNSATWNYYLLHSKVYGARYSGYVSCSASHYPSDCQRNAHTKFFGRQQHRSSSFLGLSSLVGKSRSEPQRHLGSRVRPKLEPTNCCRHLSAALWVNSIMIHFCCTFVATYSQQLYCHDSLPCVSLVSPNSQ